MASNSLQYETIAENNLYRIARTRKGMDEKQVLSIMHKPYCYETFVMEDDVYDIWFYVTRTTGLDQTRMVPQNLTPLTFKNGTLVGSGYYWYYFALKEEASEMARRCPPKPKPMTQEQMDQDFEQNHIRAVPQAPTQAPAAKIQTPQVAPPAKLQSPAKASPSLSKRVPQASTDGKQIAQTTPGGQSLSRVQIGMTDTEVTNLLGTPNGHETYRIGGDIYDVWFYNSVSGFGATGRVPLTFKNSVLVGKTDKYYQRVKSIAQKGSVHGYTKDAEDMQQQESEQNFDFW
jgi:outer membrane protein assembly factor BamE (lipoprotein component of BamABCDE complex)